MKKAIVTLLVVTVLSVPLLSASASTVNYKVAQAPTATAHQVTPDSWHFWGWVAQSVSGGALAYVGGQAAKYVAANSAKVGKAVVAGGRAVAGAVSRVSSVAEVSEISSSSCFAVTKPNTAQGSAAFAR